MVGMGVVRVHLYRQLQSIRRLVEFANQRQEPPIDELGECIPLIGANGYLGTLKTTLQQ